jgi:indole-3-glycerol phosphate synthase
MSDIDVGSIVPSTRDLLQVLSTKRRSLALVGRLAGERAADDAARLHDLNVSAFAFDEASPAMQAAARATKTVPALCLGPASDRDACLAARYFGADGVCLEASLSADEWDRLAKGVRTTRMLPLASASDRESAARAVSAGARAVLIRAATVGALREALEGRPRGLTVVADVEGADGEALRSMVGLVDAVVVGPAVHERADFADLVAAVDP